ncbi:MAG: hypothetical protein RL590_30 [Actinomycetota bacterium]|jgi:VanZ family protein
MPILKHSAQISLLFNAILLASVSLNLDWAKTRAAGGQFDNFPIAVRVIYILMVFGMLYLIVFLKQFENQKISAKRKKVAQILGYLFLFSTFMQLISRSADERWNAIPAAVLAVTFFKLSKVKHK